MDIHRHPHQSKSHTTKVESPAASDLASDGAEDGADFMSLLLRPWAVLDRS